MASVYNTKMYTFLGRIFGGKQQKIIMHFIGYIIIQKGKRIRICCLIGSNILFLCLGFYLHYCVRMFIDGAVSGDLTVLIKNLIKLGIVVLGQLIIRLECNSIREYTKSNFQFICGKISDWYFYKRNILICQNFTAESL